MRTGLTRVTTRSTGTVHCPFAYHAPPCFSRSIFFSGSSSRSTSAWLGLGLGLGVGVGVGVGFGFGFGAGVGFGFGFGFGFGLADPRHCRDLGFETCLARVSG